MNAENTNKHNMGHETDNTNPMLKVEARLSGKIVLMEQKIMKISIVKQKYVCRGILTFCRGIQEGR